MKLRLNFQLVAFISHVILSENLVNETKKWFSRENDEKSHIENMPQSNCRF